MTYDMERQRDDDPAIFEPEKLSLLRGVHQHDGVAKVPKVIAEGLLEILKAVATVEKKGHNRQQNYDFARESDLVDKVRPKMAEVGLFLHQTVIAHSMQEQYTTRSGSTMFLTTLAIAFTWVHVSGEVYPVPGVFIGYGSDTGDKGVYKAATGAEKYFLMKTFLVSTGDDPEGDERVDEHAANAGAARGRARVTRGSQAGERGGKSTKATDVQRQELVRIAKDLGITTATDLMAFVRDIVRTDYKEEPPEWADKEAFAEWLKSLDATHLGGLVVSANKRLAAEAAATDNSDPGEGGDDLVLD